jgi:RNA polymerase sigma-70 factor (ECF subfamily)
MIHTKADAVDHSEVRDDPVTLIAQLFEQHHAALFTYIYRLVDDWELAHDLAQETFYQLIRTSQRLAQVENPRAWAYRIASHVAFNALKRRRRFAWLPLSASHEVAWEESAEHVDRRTDVERALARLSPDYRAPLLLYSYHGFSVREVAEALQIGESAVKNRLYRAREMFRQVYKKGNEE